MSSPAPLASSPARLASAWDRVGLVADPGSLEAWDEDVVSSDPLGFRDTTPYTERLAAARERVGLGEAVLTGQVRVDGRPLVVIAGEFGFLGGSIGTATGEPDPDLGERIVAWVVRAEGASVSGKELASHVAGLLAPHKRPRDVRFLEALPRNELGKVRKRDLTA